jgi:DNA-directed RNA polymerase specialized sigma24 family protein
MDHSEPQPPSRSAEELSADDAVAAALLSEALEFLCRQYWTPVYREVCRNGYSPEDATDVTQDFFVRMLKNGSFRASHSRKGNLRSYLFGAVKYFLASARQKVRAEKRGGKIEFISIHDLQNTEGFEIEDPSPDASPEQACDGQYSMAVLEQALAPLREKFCSAGRGRQFELLQPFLVGRSRRGDYNSVAAQLGMNPKDVALAVHRMRRRFEELLRTQPASQIRSFSRRSRGVGVPSQNSPPATTV